LENCTISLLPNRKGKYAHAMNGRVMLIWVLIRVLLGLRKETVDTPLALNLNEPAPRPQNRVRAVGTVCTNCGVPYNPGDYRDDAAHISCSQCHTDLTGEWILGRLDNLSVGTSSVIRHLAVSDVESDLDRLFVRTNWAKTYQTSATLRPLSEPADSIHQIVWLAELVRPDRLHVRQRAGNDYDEWITIGDTTCERLMVERCGPDTGQIGSHREGTNAGLRIDRLPKLLKTAAPHSAELCRYSNWEFSRLHWESIIPAMAACALGREDSKRPEEADPTTMQDVWLWNDCRIAKIKVTVKDGENPFVFSQTFAMFDVPFEIPDPRGSR